jgi:cell division protein FtsB
VKNLMIAAAVAAALSYLPTGVEAASSDEIVQIREQLQGLIQRVDRLEQENATLKGENESLKAQGEQLQAQGEYLQAETRGLRKESATASTTIGNLRGAEWASRVAVTGDLRYRYEMISDETVNALGVQTAADRYRDRIRARLNVTARPTDAITLGLGFATTENGDPRSSNQTLTGVFSRKSLDLDLGYFDWKYASWGNLIGGKMRQPFFKPGQSLFWDNDVNPEGLALTFNRGIWFGSAYNYWISEVSGAETALTADAHLTGAQIGARLPIGSSTLALAAHYYDLSAGQGRRAVFYNCANPAAAVNGTNTAVVVNLGNNNCANGNTVIGGNGVGVLANDFQVAELAAEFNTTLGALPFQVWGIAAQNRDPDDLDTAWAAGFRFGAASNYRTWEFGALYQSVEKDALFAQLIDSDFGGGVSDTEGWVVRAGYAPVRNWVINATYFLNKLNVDVPNAVAATEVDYDRLQLDFNVKF